MRLQKILLTLFGLPVVFALAACGDGGARLTGNADWKNLEAAIEFAKSAKEDVAPSNENGADVDPNTYWVSRSHWNALNKAITDAEDMLGKRSASRDSVDKMIIDLNDAADVLELAKAMNKKGSSTGLTGLEAAKEELREQIAIANELLEDVYTAEDASEIERGEPFIHASVHNDLTAAHNAAKGVVEGNDLEAITEKLAALKAAIEDFENGEGVGTRPPDITAIQALLTNGIPDRSGVEVESTTDNVPGLFLEFGTYWVTDTVDNALNEAIASAQEFVDNIANEGTGADRDRVQKALEDAIDGYQKKEGLGLVFVEVPAGNFLRYTTGTSGTGEGNQAPNGNDSYISRISISYRVAKYEITVGQWEAVMGTDWGSGDRYDAKSTNPTSANRTNFPVARISWYDAIAFCNKLSALTGKSLVYRLNNGTHLGTGGNDDDKRTAWAAITANDTNSVRKSGTDNSGDSHNADWGLATEGERWKTNGYRLPSEWEWAWAAMGANADTGDNYTRGWWKCFAGQTAANASQTRSYTNRSNYAYLSLTNTNSTTNANKSGTNCVGQLEPNQLGIYDMSGNVSEWVWNHTGNHGNNIALAYAASNGLAAEATGDVTDFRGGAATSGQYRKMVKGGDWENNIAVTYNRSAIWNRTGAYASIGYTQTGIRIVQTITN